MSITKKGYIRKYYKQFGKQRFEHCVVWEQHYGEIPKGMQVHHRDGNKQNNDISNLVLVDSLTHKRLHSGCKLIDGIWWKPCNRCGELKPITEYYQTSSDKNGKRYISGECKQCFIKRAIITKRKKREEWKKLGIKQRY